MSLFFFNDTATTEIYTLSLHDALPIYRGGRGEEAGIQQCDGGVELFLFRRFRSGHNEWQRELSRSEEHTSELQSHSDLVCRLLLEKKKKKTTKTNNTGKQNPQNNTNDQ